MSRKTFEDVLAEENEFLAKAEKRRRGLPNERKVFQKVGLAFSGGGIRSATFNLGVLQGLAELKLLERIHYLSTVSGGGYIGAWLAAWIHRSSFETVQQKLVTVGAGETTVPPRSSEARPIRFLRQFSNYLTPRRGAFSADTWTIAAVYLRNLFLNAAALVAFLVLVLLLPRFLVGAAQTAPPGGAIFIGLALVLLALTVTGLNLRNYTYGALSHEVDPPRWTRQRWILGTVVFPLWLTAILWSALPLTYPEMWQRVADLASRPFGPVPKSVAWALLGAGAYGFAWLPALVLAPASRGTAPNGMPLVSKLKKRWHVLSAFPAGALGGVLVHSLEAPFTEWSTEQLNFWPVLWLGPPLLLAVFYGIAVLHVGLMGSAFESAKREWRSRLDAWILITIAMWLGVYGIAIYAPVFVHYAGLVIGAWSEHGLLVGWLGTSVAAILEGRKGETPDGRGLGSKLLLSLAPYVFVVGLLVILSTALHRLLASVSGSPSLPSIGALSALMRDHRIALQDSLWAPTGLAFLLAVIVAGFMSWRVDINEFSMHHFYRNRLTRAYLGASNIKRANQPFTGLADDDVPISDLYDPNQYCGPYPIINTTLNLTGAKNLAWQQRKAGSFFFTPLHCGYWLQGLGNVHDTPPEFAETKSFAKGKGDKGIGLGTVMAISGAAATPNMGFYSSPALAFLMTVFNVRLGWWVGNPKFVDKRERAGPELDFYYWLSELFGNTSQDSHYLYLSDGGHFENLGIYELVRRRCRLIIACDAASDPERQFSDLGNAIEKIRNDMGVDIEIDITPLVPDENDRSEWHAVIGRIIYDRTRSSGGTQDEGMLIYLKSTLTGDEPTDVLRYAKKHAAFPHQSTGDQWFSESQFESYRALGLHTVQSVFGGMADSHRYAELALEELCTRLRERWYPPNPRAAIHFSKHATEVSKLFETLRSEKNLAFLDEQIYTELVDLRHPEGVARTSAGSDGTPTEVERRAGFYFCNQLIQLMENVYVDLNLEQTFDHPDNRGWMNTFRRWSWSEMFKTTYVVSASTYGARFQTFCRERLSLDVGALHIEKESLREHSEWENVADQLRLNEQIERHRFAQSIEDLRGDIRVYVFELEAGDRSFHVGFAVATHDAGGRVGGTLRYFRIQNQVRKMGLGRKALSKLISDHGIRHYETSPSMKKPTRDPNRVQITEDTEHRFGRLFQSALREFDEKP